eukprot:GEMP01011081.1.p1 GENE.GEMP01011081.1~~GEMP01011081.1.p1  ORF type:complete len:1088 (+),score=194.99 GEMP01011081.1:111-3266(+)
MTLAKLLCSDRALHVKDKFFFDILPRKWLADVKRIADLKYYSGAGTIIFKKGDAVPEENVLGLVSMGTVAIFVNDEPDLTIDTDQDTNKKRLMDRRAGEVLDTAILEKQPEDGVINYQHAAMTKTDDLSIGDINAVGISQKRGSTVVVASQLVVVEILWLSMKQIESSLRKVEGIDLKAAWFSLKQRLNDFRDCSFFSECGMEFLYSLAIAATEKYSPPKEILVNQGDSSDRWLGIVCEGSCTVEVEQIRRSIIRRKTHHLLDQDRELDDEEGAKQIVHIDDGRTVQIVGSLEKGQVFGELSLLGVVGKKTATVRSGPQGCNILVLSRDAVWEGPLKRYPSERNRLQDKALANIDKLTHHNFDEVESLCDWSFKAKQHLFRAMTKRFVVPGEYLCHEHATSDTLYCIRCGSFNVIVEGHIVVVLGENSLLGEMCVLETEQYCTAGVVASTLGLVFAITRTALRELFALFPTERQMFTKFIADRTKRATSKIDTNTLRRCDIFAHAPTAFLAELLDYAHVQVFYSGQTISRGDSAQSASLVLLVHGTADVEMCGSVVRTLTKEKVYGTSEFVFPHGVNTGCRVTIIARSQVQIYFIQKVGLDLLFDKFSAEEILNDVKKSILDVMAEILQDTPLSLWHLSFFKRVDLKEAEMTLFAYVLNLYRENRVALPGEIIFEENTTGTSLYFVMFGTLRVEVQSDHVSYLTTGDFFGEFAALGLAKKRSASVICDTLCSLAIIPGDVLQRSLQDLPGIREVFQKVCMARASELAAIPIQEASLSQVEASSRCFHESLSDISVGFDHPLLTLHNASLADYDRQKDSAAKTLRKKRESRLEGVLSGVAGSLEGVAASGEALRSDPNLGIRFLETITELAPSELTNESSMIESLLRKSLVVCDDELDKDVMFFTLLAGHLEDDDGPIPRDMPMKHQSESPLIAKSLCIITALHAQEFERLKYECPKIVAALTKDQDMKSEPKPAKAQMASRANFASSVSSQGEDLSEKVDIRVEETHTCKLQVSKQKPPVNKGYLMPDIRGAPPVNERWVQMLLKPHHFTV